jgi:pimeloyl-ACP methyl ester carboxylesterase
MTVQVLLVHGGASPATTWRGLEPLAARWDLVYVQRRPDHDFDVDADDLVSLLAGRPHVVAHSYGCLGTLIAAARAPELVRSLALIEPPLSHLVAGDPDVDRLGALGDEVLTRGLDADPANLRAFLRIAGAPVGDGPLPEEVVRSVRRNHGGRLPREADIRLERVRGVPALVASGDHAPALERICDHVAAALGAERAVCPGAGHFVAAAPGFADVLERFLAHNAGCAP